MSFGFFLALTAAIALGVYVGTHPRVIGSILTIILTTSIVAIIVIAVLLGRDWYVKNTETIGTIFIAAFGVFILTKIVNYMTERGFERGLVRPLLRSTTTFMKNIKDPAMVKLLLIITSMIALVFTIAWLGSLLG